MNANERVILIKGDPTKWYNQAIFIVKKEIPANKIPVDFVAEAERIINNYLVGQSRKNPKEIQNKPVVRQKKKSRFDFVLNIVMLAGCLVIAGMLLMELL